LALTDRADVFNYTSLIMIWDRNYDTISSIETEHND